MKEVWKPIKGYNGKYEVSNLGRIKSYFWRKPKMLKPSLNDEGYCRVCLQGKTYLIHRIVGLHFIPNPENKPEINHINAIKTDNSAKNLEWATTKENNHHARINGLFNMPKGEKCHRSVFTENQVLQIRSCHSQGWFTYQELADAYGVSLSAIKHIIKRRSWKHI